MSDTKKYYWLRLKEGFFDSKQIKFLRSQENGDKMCIVYLQMQLKSLKTVGVIHYDNLLSSCVEEIAFELGEPIEIVKQTVETLARLHLIEILDNGSLYLSAVPEVVGSETAAAERMRNKRNRDNLTADNTNPFKDYV